MKEQTEKMVVPEYEGCSIEEIIRCMDTEISKDDLEKVYSIWICNENIPDKEQNTITAYQIIKKDILGTVEEDESIYDLMTAIIIRRGKEAEETGILDYLEGVFSSDVKKMKQYSNIKWSEKAEKEGTRMEGLGDAIYRRGEVKGRREARIDAIRTMIQLGISKEQILTKYSVEEYEEAQKELILS